MQCFAFLRRRALANADNDHLGALLLQIVSQSPVFDVFDVGALAALARCNRDFAQLILRDFDNAFARRVASDWSSAHGAKFCLLCFSISVPQTKHANPFCHSVSCLSSLLWRHDLRARAPLAQMILRTRLWANRGRMLAHVMRERDCNVFRRYINSNSSKSKHVARDIVHLVDRATHCFATFDRLVFFDDRKISLVQLLWHRELRVATSSHCFTKIFDAFFCQKHFYVLAQASASRGVTHLFRAKICKNRPLIFRKYRRASGALECEIIDLSFWPFTPVYVVFVKGKNVQCCSLQSKRNITLAHDQPVVRLFQQ